MEVQNSIKQNVPAKKPLNCQPLRSYHRKLNDTSVGDSVKFTGEKEVGWLKQKGIDLVTKHFSDETLSKYLFSNKIFQSLATTSYSNPVLFDAIVAGVLATTIRPVTIQAMPGAKQEDKNYASAKSIATGMIGLIVPLYINTPLTTISERFLSKSILNNPEFNKHLTFNNLKDKIKEVSSYVLKASANVEQREMFGEAFVTKLNEKVKDGIIPKEFWDDLLKNKPKEVLELLKAAAEKVGNQISPTQIKKLETSYFVYSYLPKVATSILEAYLLFKLVPPIVKQLFPPKTKQSGEKIDNQMFAANLSNKQRNVFDQIKTGGVK